jgi:uncharacterized protein
MNLLLSTGNVDVNSGNAEGQTPLKLAAKRGTKETIKVLLDAGADPGLENDMGQTAMDITVGRGEIVKLLRAASNAG